MLQIKDYETEELRGVLLYIWKKHLPWEDDTWIEKLDREWLLLTYEALYAGTEEEKQNIYRTVSDHMHSSLKKIESMAIDIKKFDLMIQEKKENAEDDEHLAGLENELENI